MSETVNELVIDALIRHFADSGSTRVQTALESLRAEHARFSAEVPSLRLLLDARRNECERLERELAAEKATTTSLLHSIALIREAGGWQTQMLSELPGAVKALREQRDEARRELCFDEAWRRYEKTGHTITAQEIAAERGWDCYREGGGA